MLAWHFLRQNKKLGYEDNRLVRVGHTFKCEPDTIKLCQQGFHGSIKPIDALEYAPGPIICRVELGGRIIRGDDKVFASDFLVIAMADATETLHLMACWSAEQALKLIKNPDPRSVAAIQAKYKWLRGEITDSELDAAWAAARAAAWAAAWAAARDAAGASWNAAWAAAWAAARDVSWNAAWAAARDVSWNAAYAAQNRKLNRMFKELLR